MSILHVNIADPDIHEPKGIATAVANSTYLADGLGSGAWKVDGGAHFGEIGITSGVTAQTLAAASAYAALNPGTEWKAGVSSGVTQDIVNGKLTVSVAGVYQVNFSASFTTAALAAGTTYSFKSAVNGVAGSHTTVVTKITAGADKLSTFTSALVTLAAGDVVEMQVAGDGTSSGTAVTPTDAAFSVILMKAA